MQIEDFLYHKNLCQPLSAKPNDIEEAKWKVFDRQALAVVRLTLARTMAFNVNDIKTTTWLIKALSDMYEKPSAMNKVYLMRQLFVLEMNKGSSAAEHINELNSIISQLSSINIVFEDKVKP